MKVRNTIEEAIKDIQDGATIMAGGFGIVGIPEKLIEGLLRKGTRNLTIISNNCGIDDYALGTLLTTRQIRKMVASYVGENKEFERQFLSGELELEFVPQGTLAERIRAGGAGIPGFYTPAGVGTKLAEGKEVRTFNGKEYVLESALNADFSFVKAWKGDTAGNLIYNKTSCNFNPMMAAAGKVTIAEVEELVEVGTFDPNFIHTPGIYVQRVIECAGSEKRIERRTVRASGGN
ncbi:MAG: CoA transferase subunit A [Desulfuromonadaceae bacterium]